MTPRARSSSDNSASRFAAPRSLNAPVTWRFSSFSTTSAPVAEETASLVTAGVRRTRPETRFAAASTSASVIIRPLLQELDAENLVRTIAARRWHGYRVADFLTDQRLGQGRGNRQPCIFDVGLVHADDLVIRLFFGFLVDQPDMGAEFDVVAGQGGRVDDLDGGNNFLKLGDAAFDEGLAFPRRVVFGIFRQVAVRPRLGD